MYDFVPLALGRTTIHREHQDSSSFISYSPPYESFPPLQHGCHPYFVIFSAIQAYEAHLYKDLLDQHWELYAKLRLIASLWEDLKGFPLDENALPSLCEDQLKPASPLLEEPTTGSQGSLPTSSASTESESEAVAPSATSSATSSTTSSSSSHAAGVTPNLSLSMPASGLPASPSQKTSNGYSAAKSKESAGRITSGTPAVSSLKPSIEKHSAGPGGLRDPQAAALSSNLQTNSSTSTPLPFSWITSATTPLATGPAFGDLTPSSKHDFIVAFWRTLKSLNRIPSTTPEVRSLHRD